MKPRLSLARLNMDKISDNKSQREIKNYATLCLVLVDILLNSDNSL